MNEESRRILKRMFCPQSLAIIGAATEPTKWGGMLLRALVDIGYSGKIYPVNPRGGEAMGLKVYPSLQAIGRPVDLACICVPRENVVAALAESLEYGIPGAEILSGGFAEADDELGPKLEREISGFARRGLRILGPNCFGIYCTECGVTLMPGNEFSRKKGPVAFISQSGILGVDLAHLAHGQGVGFTQIVSYGNACDINETDLLEYYVEDPQTRVITGYLEGVKDSRKFFDVARKVALKKPIILWRGGLTEQGSRAVVSHTGSMAADRVLWQGLAHQANIVPVSNVLELLDVAMAFLHLPASLGERLAVVGAGGSTSVLAADTADAYGLSIPTFSEKIRKQLEQILPPPGNILHNPCDVGSPVVPPAPISKILEIAAGLPDIDVLVLVQIPYHIIMSKIRRGAGLEKEEVQFGHHLEMIACLKEIREQSGKPVVMVLGDIAQAVEQIELEELHRQWRDLALEAGIPVFSDVKSAFRALSLVIHYYRKRKEISG
ncbi:acetate--CoA ligase family protein [Thermodesulfobacteriota bacterium]